VNVKKWKCSIANTFTGLITVLFLPVGLFIWDIGLRILYIHAYISCIYIGIASRAMFKYPLFLPDQVR